MSTIDAASVRLRSIHVVSRADHHDHSLRSATTPKGWKWLHGPQPTSPWYRANTITVPSDDWHADMVRLELSDGSDVPEGATISGDKSHLCCALKPEKTIGLAELFDLWRDSNQ